MIKIIDHASPMEKGLKIGFNEFITAAMLSGLKEDEQALALFLQAGKTCVVR